MSMSKNLALGSVKLKPSRIFFDLQLKHKSIDYHFIDFSKDGEFYFAAYISDGYSQLLRITHPDSAIMFDDRFIIEIDGIETHLPECIYRQLSDAMSA